MLREKSLIQRNNHPARAACSAALISLSRCWRQHQRVHESRNAGNQHPGKASECDHTSLFEMHQAITLALGMGIYIVYLERAAASGNPGHWWRGNTKCAVINAEWSVLCGGNGVREWELKCDSRFASFSRHSARQRGQRSARTHHDERTLGIRNRHGAERLKLWRPVHGLRYFARK